MVASWRSHYQCRKGPRLVLFQISTDCIHIFLKRIYPFLRDFACCQRVIISEALFYIDIVYFFELAELNTQVTTGR